MEHSRFGYSAIKDYETCPYMYQLKYVFGWNVDKDLKADDPLIVGTAIHRAIEVGFETAEKEYFDLFPVISDEQITEMMKVEIQSEKVRRVLDKDTNPLQHEVKIKFGEFIGTIDLLEDMGDGHFNIYDFKYTSNDSYYRKSNQLMLYKYFFEKTHPNAVVDHCYFIIIPKSTLKQEQNEDLFNYRQRLINSLEKPYIFESAFIKSKIDEYFAKVEDIHSKDANWDNELGFYTKNRIWNSCKWCDYKNFCERGVQENMILPSTDRRTVGSPTKRKIWIYGASMSGKTTFLDSAPDPLNLNTDGNIQFVSMPYVAIKDEVTVTGRMTNRKFAWEVFKEAISELEKKQNDFKTIIVDLVEDTREMCRLYKYDEMGIQHESDSGYGKGWDIIKTEYLSTIRRLFNLDYENIIVVSHETISEVKKKNGQTITKIAPNIQEAIANKIAGMVDIVARVVVEDDGSRTLNFKSNEFIFGGGRLKNLKVDVIPLDWNELMSVYETDSTPVKKVSKKVENPESTDSKEYQTPIIEESEPEAPKTRRSRSKAAEKPVEEPVLNLFDTDEDLPFEIGSDPEPKVEEPVSEVTERPRRTRRTRN